MSQDLLQRIIANYYEDYGSLHVKALERQGEDLVIYAAVKLDEDPDLPKRIRMTCRSYKETNLEPRFYESLNSGRDHVLLWHYNQPHIVATFHGHVEEPLAVVGALYERHAELVEGWIPFAKYLNEMPLSELIRGGFGCLRKGPNR